MTARTLFVPGRVELFGKHVDYGGGPSLTCAVELGITATIEPIDRPILEVVDEVTHRRTRAPLRRDARATAAQGGTYVAAVARRMSRDFAPLRHGVRVTTRSDLPRSSGLSSSSALVVLLTIAVAEANRLRERRVWRDYLFSPLALAEYAAAIEMGGPWGPFAGDEGVGTRGGAQDHIAICCNLAEQVGMYAYLPAAALGRAPFPATWSLVIAVSGVKATKTAGAMGDYNRAADELRGLLASWNAATERTDHSLRSVLAAGPEAIEQLTRVARGGADPDGLLARLGQFRAETGRIVPAALEAFRAADARGLGALAVESQQLAELVLRNQVPETMLLARAAMDAGAHAASAFGAGFGGAVWAVVDTADAEAVTARWRARYLRAFPARESQARWVTVRPGSGVRWP